MSRGHDRERDVRAMLEAFGYVVIRAAGSLGEIDLVVLRARSTLSAVRFIEVKATRRPFEHFGPSDRAEILEAADRAGATAELAWLPAGAGRGVGPFAGVWGAWLPAEDWPT